MEQCSELKACISALEEEKNLLRKTYEQLLGRERAEREELETKGRELEKAVS